MGKFCTERNSHNEKPENVAGEIRSTNVYLRAMRRSSNLSASRQAGVVHIDSFRKFLAILLVEPLALFAVTDRDPGGAPCDVIQDPQDLVLGRAAVDRDATAIEQDCAMRFAS